MRQKKSFFIYWKWTHISVIGIIRFFCIVIIIILEPIQMGQCDSYFHQSPRICAGLGYIARLRSYDAWCREIMTLAHFKQIWYTFHPEVGPFENENREQCYQLWQFICSFNSKDKTIFDLGPYVCFDKGDIATILRYCPVRMYNKEKPEKFYID